MEVGLWIPPNHSIYDLQPYLKRASLWSRSNTTSQAILVRCCLVIASKSNVMQCHVALLNHISAWGDDTCSVANNINLECKILSSESPVGSPVKVRSQESKVQDWTGDDTIIKETKPPITLKAYPNILKPYHQNSSQFPLCFCLTPSTPVTTSYEYSNIWCYPSVTQVIGVCSKSNSL